jgi:hypothetical protein
VNTHTAFIRSFGITGVLLALSLTLLAFVSAIVAFDRWPEGAGASAVERVAVEPAEARRVETVVVRQGAPVVRGVSAVRASSFAAASGSGGALPAGNTSEGVNTGGGFGPPPPRVGVRPPGEGSGGLPRQVAGGGGPPPTDEPSPIRAAACGARDAVSSASTEAGQALNPACDPGRRAQGPLVGALSQTGSLVRDGLGLKAR